MTVGPPGRTADALPRSEMRPSHADRERVAEVLREDHVECRLSTAPDGSASFGLATAP